MRLTMANLLCTSGRCHERSQIQDTASSPHAATQQIRTGLLDFPKEENMRQGHFPLGSQHERVLQALRGYFDWRNFESAFLNERTAERRTKEAAAVAVRRRNTKRSCD